VRLALVYEHGQERQGLLDIGACRGRSWPGTESSVQSRASSKASETDHIGLYRIPAQRS
jgi:hypothetical protein